ncbi:unnamed protein product [Adineta steineri]|uniref:Methyltransferase domain-containing protein n=1 Tax=Adineta steineri TaxID=433720 RepID=A0A816D0J4_9BILA|nr:unnamed protein product [Adineta steineri]CAF1630921.1 unnamed protein product [Adineta steineri]
MLTHESSDKITSSYIDEPPIKRQCGNFFCQLYFDSSLGHWSFLEFAIQQSPTYEEILEKCKNEDATVIDFGCCLGQDTRQLIYDGVPVDNVHGYELDPSFIEQGYELFRDGKLMQTKNSITTGDIFDDQFLNTIQPADYLYVGSFIHLFDRETQKQVCHRLTRICKQAITGRQRWARFGSWTEPNRAEPSGSNRHLSR